ncbi:MAG: winged helix-turn-helix domain-containing protein [Gammaproteobacteria bacterium]|nr:winged helix-turn-helix domain-containing protein [Gammaproteobacteria bacterium]
MVTKADMSLNVLDKPISQWDRSIDVHISNLRRKIGLHEDGSERIRTLRGSGYLYVSQARAP